MTAEQQPNGPLFPIPTFTTTTTNINDNVNDKILKWTSDTNKTLKKKRRLSIESELLPPEKALRKNHQGVELEKEALLIDISKMSQKDMLLAYKRIWDNLDMSKPTDAKLEPFVWHKIREYQKKLSNDC